VDRRRAARPRAVPAADRAVVLPANNRRVRSHKVISAGGVAFISTWLNSTDASQPTKQGGPRLPCCAWQL
jgi:hypothetical protein